MRRGLAGRKGTGTFFGLGASRPSDNQAGRKMSQSPASLALAAVAAVFFGAAVAGCGGEPAAGPEHRILVFAAASTTNAVNEIKTRFAKDSGVTVEANYAASAALAQQVVRGAEADVFLSADTKWADYLSKKDLVARRRNLLGNKLVIVVPADSKTNISKAEDLATANIEHLALGEPASVPAGRYAEQALMKMGLWDRLREKVVPAGDVRSALAYVETKAAEAGIVYATDAAISRKVKVAAEIPERMTEPILYPMILLKHGENSRPAQSFYRYLGSPEATQVFERYGFKVLKGE